MLHWAKNAWIVSLRRKKKWVGGLKNDISIINFNIYIRLWFDMAIWTHVLNFTVLFSVSPTQLCITFNPGQVHDAQLWKWLWGIACVSESCVTDIMCAMGCLMPGCCWERSPGAQSYPHFLPVQSSSGITFDFLPPDPHNWALLLILGVPDRKSSLRKRKTNHRKLLCSALPSPAIF